MKQRIPRRVFTAEFKREAINDLVNFSLRV